MKKEYVAYYRVSTQKQGKSGLGLNSQIEAVKDYIGTVNTLVSEYQEIESGSISKRPQLLKAIEKCKDKDAILLIAKLDRLSRNAAFIFTLKESGVDFVCCDMPDATPLTIGILAVIAEDELKRISLRTRAALTEIKRIIIREGKYKSKAGRIITKLGSPNNLSIKGRRKSVAARVTKAKSNKDSVKAGAFIVNLFNQGKTFYYITKELNGHGFTTPNGCSFSAVQTKRLYERYK